MSFNELIHSLRSKVKFRHKIVIIICLSLSIYTVITSETLSLLIGLNRNYSNDLLNNKINDRRRGVRTTDPNGNLLFYHLPNLTDYDILVYYKKSFGDEYCFSSGTDWNQTSSSNRCVCLEDYYGYDCGIPSVVFNKQLNQLTQQINLDVKRLEKPKRVVLSVIMFTSDDCQTLISGLNSTLSNISDFVDLIIIYEIKTDRKLMDKKLVKTQYNITHKLKSRVESNVKNLNESKLISNYMKLNQNSCRLRQIFNKQLNKYSDLVLIKSIKFSPKILLSNDTKQLDLYLLSKLWNTCIRSVTEFRPNDILIYLPYNSLPVKEILMFVKHYQGFPEPIQFTNPNHLTDLILNFAFSFEYLSLLCRYDFNLFQTNLCLSDKTLVKKFTKTYWPIKPWIIDNNDSNTIVFNSIK